MLRSELYGFTNELVLGLFNIKFAFLCSQFLILHQKEFTTTSANKLLFRPFWKYRHTEADADM